MLLVSGFTFFGVSAIQNLSCFTEVFDDLKVSLSLNAQEEENETSNNEEVNEVKEKLDKNTRLIQLAYEEEMKVREARQEIIFPSSAFVDVITPPPQA